MKTRQCISHSCMVFVVILSTGHAWVYGQRGGRDQAGGDRGGDFRTRMLGRFDTNGNGIVEPNEIPEQARRFVDRMAEGAGIAPGQPIPIAQVTGGGDRRGGSGGRGPDGDRSRRGSEPSSRSEGSADNRGTQDLYPRVPRFGDDSVRGFGVSPESLAGKLVDLEKKYDRRILGSVERSLERYDKNKNGLLDHDEWADVSWRSDPRESDVDNDGLLTQAELAEYYKKREANWRDEAGSRGRGGDPRGRDPRGGSSDGGSRGRDRGGWNRGGRDPRGGGPGGWNRGGGDPRGGRPGGWDRGGGERGRGGRGFDPVAMIARFDRNEDGTIDPDEVDDRVKQMLEARFQMQLDKPVEIETLAEKIRAGMSGQRSNQSDTRNKEPDIAKGYRVTGADKLQGRHSYRIRPGVLPRLLPDWWKDRDVDQDGQVVLREFAKRIDGDVVHEFERYDRNRDGVITAHEASVVETER